MLTIMAGRLWAGTVLDFAQAIFHRGGLSSQVPLGCPYQLSNRSLRAKTLDMIAAWSTNTLAASQCDALNDTVEKLST